jgi:predicted amidohydrolase YtcJ
MTELYLINGDVYTQDPGTPRATAVAVRDGRFLAVGTDDEIRELTRFPLSTGGRQGQAPVIDLEGRRVLPGLTDAHFHLYDWALGLGRLQLADTRSLEDLCERVALRVRETPPGRWILGQGWNEAHWPVTRIPRRSDLDDAAPDHPVLLWRSDLHLAVVNTLALKEAGITASTSDPPEGIIDRDRSGQPTGVLRELAINLVSGVVPPVTEDETMAYMREGIPRLHRQGLTGLHDFRIMGGADGPPAFRAYQRLRAAGELALRLWMLIPGELLDEAIALGLHSGMGDSYLRIGHVKLFSDGAQGPRTAWMLEAFLDEGHCGMPLTPMNEIAEAVRRADQAGLAVAVHAIGDRANRELLAVFEQCAKRKKRHSVLHRVEHVQNIRPSDVARLGGLGVVASVQPIHVTDDIPVVELSVGDRARFAYPLRELWDAGVTLALGSDCPVADPNPLWGIHAAVTRQRRDGTPVGGWYPAQRLTVSEAVWGFTMGPAVACGRQAEFGSITPGKRADLVVLDRDILRIEPMEIADAQVVMTVVGGRVVYRR